MERRNFVRGLIVAPFAAAAAKLGFGKTTVPMTATEGIGAAGSGLAVSSDLEQKTTMLGQLLKTPAGREMLAKSLGPSLRRRKDFMGFGSAPTIHKQTSSYVRHRDKFDLFVVGDEGGDIVYKKNYRDLGNGVTSIISYRIPVPAFSIACNPMIPLDMVFAKQFDLVARSLNIAKAEIGLQEDNYILA